MSILRRITDKFGAMRQRSKDKKEFLESILSAAEDGKLSDSEVTELQTRLKELELTDEDIREEIERYDDTVELNRRQMQLESELTSAGWYGPHGRVI